MGFKLENPSLSYIVSKTDAKSQTVARIEVSLNETFSEIVHDSGKRTDIDSLSYELPIELRAGTRYYWRVHVWTDKDEYDVSDPV